MPFKRLLAAAFAAAAVLIPTLTTAAAAPLPSPAVADSGVFYHG